MFSALKAKDDAYFRAFATHAEKVKEASRLLVELLEFPSHADRLAPEIKKIEHDADTITHDTIRQLHETWITPMDRTDIHALITALDDVIDGIEAVSERVAIFELRHASPLSVEIARVIQEMTADLSEAVRLLPTLSRASKEIIRLCHNVDRQESEADRLYRQALAQLFRAAGPDNSALPFRDSQPPFDPLNAMKWRDVFEYLESTADFADRVATLLEGIVLEYA